MTTPALEEFSALHVAHVASTLVRSGNSPFDLSAIRWGLRHLGDVAARDPLGSAGQLIDVMLQTYDSDIAPRLPYSALPPVCFAPCGLPEHGCEGNIDGVTVRHVANGMWAVEGRVYPPDRLKAERAARRSGALRKLAQELGVREAR